MAVFTFGFFQFARFSNANEMGGVTATTETLRIVKESLSGKPMKIAFADGQPKLFVESLGLQDGLVIAEGSRKLAPQSMIIGAEEAGMMKKEKLIEKAGDTLPNFFGVDRMTVAGMLAPTGTVMDVFHVVEQGAFADIQSTARVEIASVGDETKLFYWITRESVPVAYRDILSPEIFTPIVIGGKSYQPIYIGSREASMMQKEKLFQKEGDLLPGFFGNDVIVAGILPETNTALDMFHYVGLEFELKK